MPKQKNKAWRIPEEVKNFSKISASLEDFFRNSDLGRFGGESPKLFADMISQIRTGPYKAWDILKSYGCEALLMTRIELDLTDKQIVKYVSNPKFPDYVVKVCQRQEFPEWHAQTYIYLALIDIVNDEKKSKK